MRLISRFSFMCIIAFFISIPLKANENNTDTIAEFEKKIALYQGQVVYIDFWASWCVPCRKSFPWMESMQKQYADKGLKIITVNLDSQRSNADDFLTKYSANLDVVYDPKGVLATKFKVKGMPNSFIVNRAGKLVSAHVGFNKMKQVEYQKEIITLLGNTYEK